MSDVALFIVGFTSGGLAMTWGMSIIGLARINEAVTKQGQKR